jgi:hypothetical protein
MRATASPLGVLTDPGVVGALVALLAMIAALLRYFWLGPRCTPALAAVVLAPVGVALVTWARLAGARRRVVDWLARLPFEVGNMNALLDGVAQNLEVRFAGEPPGRDALNAVLEAVHPDCFALAYHEEEHVVQVRIGVLESKLNPAAANHRRFRRVVALVEQALVPLGREHAIVSVWIA